MKKENNDTPEASFLSSCELALEDLELISRELVDKECEVIVGGLGVDSTFGSTLGVGVFQGVDSTFGSTLGVGVFQGVDSTFGSTWNL